MIRRSDITATALWLLALFLVIYVSTYGKVVLNGTASLPHNAYLMISWPKTITHGRYVIFPPPAVVAGPFDGAHFVKRIQGLPGDQIKTDGQFVCVNATCSGLRSEMLARGFGPNEHSRVPDGHVYVVGDSPSSLDSRYQAIGLVKIDDIQAVGWPVSLPHWTKIANWLEIKQ